MKRERTRSQRTYWISSY